MHEWELNLSKTLSVLLQIAEVTRGSSRVFHIHGSFGDVYLQCAVMKEAMNHDTEISALVDPIYDKLCRLSFRGHKVRGVLVDAKTLNDSLSRMNILGSHGVLPTRMLPTLYPIVVELILSGKLQQSQFLRELVKSPRTGHFFPLENSNECATESFEILRAAGLPFGKTIILCTDNNTQKEFSGDFWLNIVLLVRELGLTPCINDSGTFYGGQSKFNPAGVPRIKVPPHLVVSLATAAGSYIVGTNGYATIQALFNSSVAGLHLINATSENDGFISDKSGNPIPLPMFFHANSFKNEFLKFQTELLIRDEDPSEVYFDNVRQALQSITS